MKIFIDNGHGLDTPGKHSPDGTFREAIYNREIARRIVLNLVDRGYDAELLVKGKVDFPQIGLEKGTTERGVSKVSKSC